MRKRLTIAAALLSSPILTVALLGQIGSERAVPVHLQDGEEYTVPLRTLLRHGERLFTAMWTREDGGGRPLTKGTGAPLSDPTSPLVFPRNFNRISGPDTNSCSGCHNKPFVGGGGDIANNVFVLGQRFDFATFDAADVAATRGAFDERGRAATLQTIANSRRTVGMFGSGFIEMLARQITVDLQQIRDLTPPGGLGTLTSKGIAFGVIGRRADGTWDTSRVSGIPGLSLQTTGPQDPPSLIIRPFSQASNVISLRQFTNNAFNHHHGIQSEERFGVGVDADGDGVVNELTRADVTAATIFQAALAVPGRVVSRDREVREAVKNGEKQFAAIGCASCHVPSLALTKQGWLYSEPSPFNPAGNLRVGEAPSLTVDLTSARLPPPRLQAVNGIVQVPAYTDFKLHDITSGPDDPNREPLDMNSAAGSDAFAAGNGQFLTRRLWGIANQHSFGHHGLYTTMREAVLAHAGEAQASRSRFEALGDYDRNSVIEFLKSLRILPPGTLSLCVTEEGEPVSCAGDDHGDRHSS